jgi:undecaprenyl-diphosphatase
MTTTLDPTSDAPVSAPRRMRTGDRPPQRGAPLWLAFVLFGIVFLGGVILAIEPGRNVLDSWGFTVFSVSLRSGFLRALADLGLGPVTVGVAVVGGAVIWRRDRRRAFACLGGPAVAVELAELIKMIVGRRFEGVLCWPSGSAAAVAAMVTVAVLVTRGIGRWAAIILGSATIVLEIVALVAFRWHYLSDTFGGVLVGVGSVVLVDAVLHRLRLPGRRRPTASSETV